jgi:hypothetical protein
MNQTSSLGEGHYGRGIGDVISMDLSNSPYVQQAQSSSLNLNSTAWGQAEDTLFGTLPTLSGAVALLPQASNSIMTWLQQNILLVAVGGVVGLLLFRKGR